MRKLSEILFYLPDRKSRFHDAENYFVGIKRISFYFISFFFTLKRKFGFKSKLPQVNFTSINILKKKIKY